MGACCVQVELLVYFVFILGLHSLFYVFSRITFYTSHCCRKSEPQVLIMATILLTSFHQFSGHELFIDKMEGAFWSSLITPYLTLRPLLIQLYHEAPSKTYMCLTSRISHTAI